MKKVIIRFGLLSAALLVLLVVSRFSLMMPTQPKEVFYGLFAVLFIVFGIVLSRQVFRPKPVQVQAPPPNKELDLSQLESLGISKREYEVLEWVAKGHSNKEIAEALFVSESTIKTHVSNLLVKLDAKRRTQAVTRAKELRILE